MTRYAVIGDPVSHSKSPLIHSNFAEQTGEDVQYEKIHVSSEELDDFVKEFFSTGGGGLNVTVPHKESVFKLADLPSERARLAQAANTLWLDSEQNLCADNTDGVGLVRDLTENLGVSLKAKSILVLGAGGSVRGILPSLIEAQPADIMILNRTLARAESIQNEFEHLFPLQAGALDYAPAEGFDVILNATSSSIAGELPPLNSSIIGESCACYDLMYSDTETVFMQWAREQGSALVVDGLGMLVEQAAESFAIWRGVRPDTRSIRSVLR